MRLAYLLVLSLLILPAFADVYKTTDKNGNVIYTDSPKSDKAEKVELREINTVPSAQPTYAPDPGDDVRAQIPGYEIKIISPRNDVSIPLGQRDLAIAVALDRPLEGDHLLVYFMDGELLEETGSTNIIVRDIMRGTHTITVEAMDADGQSLGASEPVIVNLMRPPVKKPAPPVNGGG